MLKLMMWLLRIFLIMVAVLMRTAHADFLPPDQAFQFEAVSTSQEGAELTWKIADGYYLYHDQLKVSHDQKALKLSLPVPQDKDDPTFGRTQVHYGVVSGNGKYSTLRIFTPTSFNDIQHGIFA